MRPTNVLLKTQGILSNQTESKFKHNHAVSEATNYSLGQVSHMTQGVN